MSPASEVNAADPRGLGAPNVLLQQTLARLLRSRDCKGAGVYAQPYATKQTTVLDVKGLTLRSHVAFVL